MRETEDLRTGIMLVLQPRDRRLLQAVSQLKIVDKKQAQELGGFGSNARLNARLYKLTHAGFLRCYWMATELGGKKSLYTLTSEGAAAGDSASALSFLDRDNAAFTAGTARFVRRQLLVNEAYIAALKPSGREIELKNRLGMEERFTESLPFAPDGCFEFAAGDEVHPMFLQVDEGAEPLQAWTETAARYAALAANGEVNRMFGSPHFRVLVVASSEERMRSMMKATEDYGPEIFWFASAKRLRREGFWSPIWFQATGEQGISLL